MTSLVDEDGAVVRTTGYQATMTPAQERDADAYVAQLEANPFSPPTDGDVNPEILALLIDRGAGGEGRRLRRVQR